MPPRRYVRPGRKPAYKPRRYKQRARAMRSARVNRMIHSFKRMVSLGTYTATATSVTDTPVAKAFSFQLTDLPNVTEYSSLFDQYKISGVQLRIVPKVAMTTQGSSTGTIQTVGYGQVVTAIDFDDAANPTAKDELLQYQNAKVTQASRLHTRFIKPRILDTVWVNSISSGYQSVRPGWVDLANTNMPHYGIKLWVDAPANSGGTTSSSVAYDVYAVYYFKCKNTR